MAYDGYACLRTRVEDGVAWVTIDHPPINLFDMALILEMLRVGEELEARRRGPRGRASRAPNPEFFIAHADVALIQTLPADGAAEADEARLLPRDGRAHAHACRRRRSPRSRASRAAAAASSCSRATCASARSARACSRSPRSRSASSPAAAARSGCRASSGARARSRSSSAATTSPADLAERWGYLNRALPPAELGAFVDRLARRIASLPGRGDRAREARGRRRGRDRRRAGLLEEAHCFNRSVATLEARERMAAFLAAGGQTLAVERELRRLLGGLGRR